MFVEVAVDFSDADRLRSYTYSVPDRLNVQPGDLVWIPFGYRPAQGIALAVSETTETQNVRAIDSVVDGGPFISENLLETARWIADHYRTNIFRACVAMLPPGANQQLHIWVNRTQLAQRINDLLTGYSISQDQQSVLNELPERGRIRRDRFVRKIGRANERHLDALVRAGVVTEESIWERPRAKPIFKPHIQISDTVDFDAAVEQYVNRRAHRRADLLRHLVHLDNPIPRAELSKRFSSQTIKA